MILEHNNRSVQSPYDGLPEMAKRILFEMKWRERDLSAFECSQRASKLDDADVYFYCVEEVTFEEEAPRQEALENVLSCMNVPGIMLVYLLLGDRRGVKFYFGVARDASSCSTEMLRESGYIEKIGDLLLRRSIEGNFRGSRVKKVDADARADILRRVRGGIMSPQGWCEVLKGVPGKVRDKERQDFRGVDRLVDVMLGDDFGLMVLARPMTELTSINRLQKDIFDAYRLVSPLVRKTQQKGESRGTSSSHGTTTGSSEQKSSSTSKSENVGTSDSTTQGTNENTSTSNSSSHTKQTGSSQNSTTTQDGSGSTHGSHKDRALGKSKSTTTGTSDTVGTTTSNGTSDQKSENEGESCTEGTESINKAAQDCIKYLDEVLLPRLDYGRGKGIFTVTSVLFANDRRILRKLSNTTRSLYAGETENRVPLWPRGSLSVDEREHLGNFQIPRRILSKDEAKDLRIQTAAWSNSVDLTRVDGRSYQALFSGTWMSAGELAVIAGLPRKEVVGVVLREEVDFGLNVPSLADEEGHPEPTLQLGSLVQSGVVKETIPVELAKSQLDRHVFVAGVTGSGKTTTCQNLLLDSGWNFLVIEPAKTEYRGLLRSPDGGPGCCSELLVFTLGNDLEAPFRLNPLEFLPHESISSRVDMIKASIEAAFEMQAAIPQIIERAIYDAYEACGWNIQTSRNEKYGDTAWDNGVFAFPTLSDVIEECSRVVKKQGFSDRLGDEYIGTIRALLQGLTVGMKGLMLNCRRSLNFERLLERKVVLELENVTSGAEKSLIIGFVVMNLLQAIKEKYAKTGPVRHMTLIEEAHRLLSRAEGAEASSRKLGAETFADMLAEIRKYGESLVIADQIPNKLMPEVLKNTNTKIVHCLFARDDKEAIGATMALGEEQRDFLSHLVPGRAIVFNGKWPKAVQVQMRQIYKTDTRIDAEVRKAVRERALQFYADNAARGALDFSETLHNPQAADVDELLRDFALGDQQLLREYKSIFVAAAKATRSELPDFPNLKTLKRFCEKYGEDKMLEYLARPYGGVNWLSRIRDPLKKVFHLFAGETTTMTSKEVYDFGVKADVQRVIDG